MNICFQYCWPGSGRRVLPVESTPFQFSSSSSSSTGCCSSIELHSSSLFIEIRAAIAAGGPFSENFEIPDFLSWTFWMQYNKAWWGSFSWHKSLFSMRIYYYYYYCGCSDISMTMRDAGALWGRGLLELQAKFILPVIGVGFKLISWTY